MKMTSWNLAGTFALALLPASLAAQALPDNPNPAPRETSGWTRVQNLANGQQITVARPGGESVPCIFAGATTDYLFCNSLYSGREYRFNRAQVARIRMDDKYRNMRILIGGLAVTGLIWGVATPPSNGTPRALDGLVGAAAGAFAGLVVSFPIALMIPGRTVFHQSNSKRNTHWFDPAQKTPQPDPGQSGAEQ
jgi:hypothetical protein